MCCRLFGGDVRLEERLRDAIVEWQESFGKLWGAHNTDGGNRDNGEQERVGREDLDMWHRAGKELKQV